MTQYPSNTLDRIKKPLYRGNYPIVDSSETGFALLSAANKEGKIYCLINDVTKKVEKASFLSFGKLESVVVFDLFCEFIQQTHIDSACSLATEYLVTKAESELSENHLKPEHFSFLKEIQDRLKTAIPTMVVTPPPEKGKERYKRKDKDNMTEDDLKWLPLTAPEKIAKAEAVILETLKSKTQLGHDSVGLYNIKNDLEVILQFNDTVESTQTATITIFIQENMRTLLHPQIIVKEKEA